MSLVLYEHPLSPYAQKCKIALREKAIEFDAITPIGLGTGEIDDPRFNQASPRREVPVLVDGDVSIFDSTIILEYIEERWPTPPLMPVTPAERARVRMLEDAMDTHYEAINWGLGELRFFARGAGPLANSIEARAGEQLQAWFGYLEGQLAARKWFNGDAFGWADLAVIPYLNGSVGFGFAPAPDSSLARWRARMLERPAVARTSEEALATIPAMSGVANLVAQGLMKREYRDHRLEWMIASGGLDIVLAGLAADDVRFTPMLSLSAREFN